MPYTILRVKKLKTAGSIQAVGQHLLRGRETPNADPERECRTLIGLADPWDGVQQRIAAVEAKIRKNGVLACEVFVGASPEYFRPHGGEGGTWDADRLQAWVPKALSSITQEWGAENVVGAYLHLDETTPHIQAIVVPIDPQTSKLNASRWLDGRKALSDLQDRHARDMAPLGLERGIRGSLANHTEVRDWYGQMKAPLGSLPTPMVQTPGLMLTGGAREGWAEQETERLKGTLREPLSQLQTQARAYHHAADKRDEYEATAKQLAKELADTKAKLSEAKEELTRLRPIAELVRGLPLSTAASYFEDEELVEAGLHIGPDQAGRERVFDQKGKVVGRNAIDLVMLATKEDYAGAVTWLVGRGGAGAAQRAAVGFVVENANHVVERSMVTAVSPPVIEKRLTLAVERGRRRKVQGERGWSAHFKRHGFGMRYAKDTLTFIEVFSGLQIPATHGQVSLMSSVREELETDAKHRWNWSDRPRGPSR